MLQQDTTCLIDDLTVNTIRISGSGSGSVLTLNNNTVEKLPAGNPGDVLTLGPGSTVSFLAPGAPSIPDPLIVNEVRTNSLNPNAGTTINLGGPLVSTANNSTTFYGFGSGGGTNQDNTAFGYNALGAYAGNGVVAVGSGSLQNTTVGSVLSVGTNGCQNTNQTNLVNIGNSGMQSFTGTNAVNVGNSSMTVGGGSDLVYAGNSNIGIGGNQNVVIGNNNTGSTNSGNKIVGSQNDFSAAVGTVLIGDTKDASATDGAVLIGSGAGNSCVSGNLVAVGKNTAENSSNTTGNICIGEESFRFSSGNNNIAVGAQSLRVNAGSGSVAVGFGAARNSTASDVVCIGTEAAVGGGNPVVAVGSGALRNNTTHSSTVAVGYLSGESSGGANKIFMGERAGQSDGSTSNIAIGTNCLQGGSTGTGLNVLVGNFVSPLSRNIEFSTVVGQNSLQNGTAVVDGCTTVGYGAVNNPGGNISQIVAVGRESCSQMTASTGNTATGYRSGFGINGDFNTIMGHQAGYSISGSDNVVVGAGNTNFPSTVSDSVLVGKGVGNNTAAAITNSVNIGSLNSANSGGITNAVSVGLGATLNSTAVNSVVVGAVAARNSTAVNNSVVCGYGACDIVGTQSESVVIGYNAVSATNSSVSQSVVVGSRSLLNGTGDGQPVVSVGFNTMSHGGNKNGSIVVGNQSMTNVLSTSTITVGNGTNGNGINIGNNSAGRGIIVGNNTGTNTAGNNILVGNNVAYSTNALGCVILGDNMQLGTNLAAFNNNNVVIGSSIGNINNNPQSDNITIGRNLGGSGFVGTANVVMGLSSANAVAHNNSNVIIGDQAGNTGSANFSVMIGRLATCNAGVVSGIAIGNSATCTASGNVQLGNNAGTGGQMFFGSQRVGDSAWIGGGLTGASIDNSGNIIRTPSDERLKKNIEPISAALSLLENIPAKYYEFRDTSISASREAGIMAQDLIKTIPHLVSTADKYMSVNYEGLIPYLLRAIQELSERVRYLEKK